MTSGQKGFVAIHFLSFLPLLLAVGFCLYLFLSFSDSHIEMTQTCLREQLKIQQSVKSALHNLLKLNPRAAHLRTQYHLAQLRCIAVAAIPPALAVAKAHRNLIYAQRQILDLQQKALIKMANAQIAWDQNLLKLKLFQIGQRRKKDFQSFMVNEVSDLKFKPTHLSVIADDQSLAPTYSLSRNFIEDQALEFTWSLKTISQKAMAHFLPARSQFPQSCSTTINTKESAWPTVYREVKSPWKLRS